ncbi:MAG: hypothetical protein HZA49_05165 [Planctomycetes bacterium]|nr:hypothetical protein [Planctomycetota bacterium]
METLRKFIAMVFFVYVILVTVACLWLGLSRSSLLVDVKKAQLDLEQVKEKYDSDKKNSLNDNTRIAEQLVTFQKERDAAKAEYQNALSRTERLITESDAAKKKLEATRTELAKTRNEKAVLETERQATVEPLIRQAQNEARVSYEKEKLKITRELDDVREFLRKVQSERDSVTTEYQKNKSENSLLRDEKAALEKKVSTYDKQLRNETQEKNKLKEESGDLREANNNYSKENAGLILTNAKLQQQSKETAKELSLLKTLLADSKEQVAKLNRERDGLDVQFNAEKSEKGKYYDESKKYRELSDKLAKELSAEKDTARKLSEELKTEKMEKTGRINELAKLSDDLKSRNKILAEDLRKTTTEKEDVLIKWKSADDKIVLMEKDIRRLEDGKKSLEAKYESRDKEFQKTESEYQKTQRSLAKLEQEYTAVSETLRTSRESEARIKEQLAGAQKSSREIEARLRTEIGKNEDQVTALASQNTGLQDSLTKTKSDLQSAANSLKSEQAEKYKYYEEYKMQMAKNTELQRQVENANLKIQSSDEEKKLSAERLKESQVQADILRKENTNLKTQSIALDTQITQFKTQLDIASRQLADKETTLSAKIAELSKSLAQVTDEKEKIRVEKAGIEEARVRIDKDYRAVSETLRAYDAEVSKIRQVNADIQNKLAKSEELRGKTERELATLAETLKATQESERKSQEHLVALKSDTVALNSKLAKSEESRSKLEKESAAIADALKMSQEAERKSKEQSAVIQKSYQEAEARTKEQIVKSDEQITALNNTAKKLGAERESQDKQLRDLNEQLGLLAKENKGQKEQLAKLDKDIKAKAGELASLQGALSEEKAKSLDDKVKHEENQAKNEEHINTLKSDVSNLTANNKKLNKQAESQDKQLRDRDEQVMMLSKDNKDYKERNGSLEKQLSKVEVEARTKITELNDKLRSATSERDDTLSRLRFTMDKVSSLEKDIKRYDDTNKSLEAKYESRDKDYRSVEIERQKVTVDLKNANDRITLLQKDKEDVIISLKNAESQIAKTKELSARSEEELRSLQKTLKDVEAQNGSTVANLHSQVVTLKEQVGDLSKSLKVAVDEREKVKEEKSKNELSLTVVTKDNNSLKDKNDQLLKDFSALQSKIKVQEYELNEALKKERESYQQALSDLNTTRETLRGAQWQVSELQTKNATLDKSVASLQNQLKSQESDMQATIKQERDMKSNYLSRLEDAEGKINNYMKVEIDLRQKNSTLEKEMAGIKVTMNEKIAEAMKQKETDYLNRLREANERVKAMEDTLTRERSSFYAKLAEYATTSRLFDDAIEYYEKALVLAPKNATYYYNMGIIYDENIDNASKAIFCYSKYLELAPDAVDHEKVKKWIENLQKRLKGSKDSFIK